MADSMEAKFKRCKNGVKGTTSKKFAVCAHLNPAISPEKRAAIRNRKAK